VTVDSVTTDDIAVILRDALSALGMEVAVLPPIQPGSLEWDANVYVGATAPDSMNTAFSITIAYTEGQ